MAQKFFFGLTVLMGLMAIVGGIISLAWPHFLILLHLQFLADKGLARILIGCGIGLIATAFVFFKINKSTPFNQKDQ